MISVDFKERKATQDAGNSKTATMLNMAPDAVLYKKLKKDIGITNFWKDDTQ
ncbi:hypothetical protein [Sunxiuqinia sp. sy24]|uniref:hypothetical protein n=1 Tax=Sunxiuqinia sp. sy24 TaxID=3461495 RepID=UPI004045A0B0